MGQINLLDCLLGIYEDVLQIETVPIEVAFLFLL